MKNYRRCFKRRRMSYKVKLMSYKKNKMKVYKDLKIEKRGINWRNMRKKVK
jgi:hypothetical protein